MRHFNLILTAGLVALCVGCNQQNNLVKALKPNNSAPAETQAVVTKTTNDDIKLAQVILKPKRHELSVVNDPFKPLLAGSGFSVGNLVGENNLQFLGLIRMGQETSAFLKVNEDRGLYKLNDQIKQWVVAEIDSEYVLLKKDDQVLKIKRGDK